jgi:leader peptidase (prepilin peptidase)/N-methyltransferase
MTAAAVPAWLLLPAWALVGLGAGILVRWGSVRLARLEGLEVGTRAWQVYGPAVLSPVLFGLFAFKIGPSPALLISSLWVAVLVQVIFFDFEHQLILDRVLLPSGVAALVLSLVTPGLGFLPALLTGLVAGLAFLAVSVVGSLIFKAEAMGLGDVKLSVLMGLILGPRWTLSAVVVGLFLAGLIAVGLLLLRLRGRRDFIPYGPFLAAGTLAALYAMAGARVPAG